MFAKKLGSYDGSVGESLGTVDREMIPFLEGIIAGANDPSTAEDAESLIEAIKKYGKVVLTIR